MTYKKHHVNSERKLFSFSTFPLSRRLLCLTGAEMLRLRESNLNLEQVAHFLCKHLSIGLHRQNLERREGRPVVTGLFFFMFPCQLNSAPPPILK